MKLETSQEIECSIVACTIGLRIGFPDEQSAKLAHDQYIGHNHDVSDVAHDEDGWFVNLECDLSKISEVESQLDEINDIARQFDGEPLDPEDLTELQQNPCFQNLSLLSALSAYENDDYDAAIDQLTQLIEDGVADPVEFLGVVGLAYLKSGDFETARQTFESHLDLDLSSDDRSASICNLATCLFRLGKFEASEHQYIAALETPKHGYACYGLACLRCRENKVDETLDWLSRAVRAERCLKTEASTDEDFANIADDPRFAQLTRVGIWDRLMLAVGQ